MSAGAGLPFADRCKLRSPARASIHARFVEAARKSVVRLAEIESEVSTGELTCGEELNDQLYRMPSADEAEDAISDLEDRGSLAGS